MIATGLDGGLSSSSSHQGWRRATSGHRRIGVDRGF